MKRYYPLAKRLTFLLSILFCYQFSQSQNIHPSHDHTEAGQPSNCLASPLPTNIVQPNNTTITIVGRGNLNNNWTETTDGYSITLNSSGLYEYAKKQSGKLVPDGVLAKNPSNRSLADQNYLSNVSQSLKPDLSPLKTSILNQLNAQVNNKVYPTSGNIRVLALLIDYPDLAHTYDTSDFDSLLQGANFRNGDGSFKVFYETASDSQLTISVDVRGWFTADSNYIYYGNDSGSSRAADLVREAVDAAEVAGVDFSNYDNNNDNRVDGILAVHSGPGAEQGSRTQYIWSHRWVLNGGTNGQVTYDGVTINDYMINPEIRTAGANNNLVGIGVFCHEFGHNLGLPDLYDTDDSNGDSEGIGEWGLMGSAGYLGGEHRPGNFCAWSKEDLGWITPTTLSIGTTGIYTLDAASENINEVFKVNTSLNNEYFLLENRQKLGLDSDLKGNGLAIWHINTTKTNGFGNKVNGDEDLKGVDLEEADGNDDLDNENNRADNGDLFPGNSSNTSFDKNSTPNSDNYQLTNTGLEIRDITESNNVITFSFGPAPGPPCSATTTLTSTTGSFSDGSSDTLEYANNQSCSWLIQVPSGVITLNFSSFRTEATNDSVTVYDGSDATATLLGNFSGTSIPQALTSSSNEMYIEFNSNSTLSDTGWTASYTSMAAPVSCTTDTLTATYGTFEDGSGSLYYDNNIQCSWLIQPPQATDIEINFNRFDTELNNDSVAIYDGTSATGTLVASFSGSNIPSSTTVSSGDVFIEFITNGSDTASGWEISYTSSPTCGGTISFTDSAGSFQDGSGPLNYDNNLSCSWVIEPSGSPASITLVMDSINLDNFSDRITVRDGGTSTSQIIGFFFGNNTGNPLTAYSGKMYVEFTTNGSQTGKGWGASYTSSDTYCSDKTTFTTPSGFFNDGSPFNQDYKNNTDCSWLIKPSQANRKVQLNFFAGTFNFSTQANKDTVTIYDGETTNAPILGTLSGTPGATSFTSTGGSLLLTFKTDTSTTSTGWRASYSTILNPTCSGTTSLTAVSGTFSDGSVDSLEYAENGSCSWRIQPPGATKVALSFTRFETESPDDVVKVYDGNSPTAPLIGTYSGAVIPPNIISSGGSLFVRFITNATVNKKGWEASYTSTTNQCFDITLNTPRDTIEDGSGSSNYSDNLNCTWLLEPTSATSISLEFTSFDLSSDDTLYIYDGQDATASLLGSYTGTTLPNIVNSTGGSMFIEFTTDGSNNAGGWKAFYDITSNLSCVGTTSLTAASGSFEDGSGTANYDVNLNCGWLIHPNSAAIIVFKMDSLQLGNGDQVKIYDGNSPAGTLLHTYNSYSATSFKALSGSMFVEFISDNAITGKGWAASYSSSKTYCLPSTVLTALNANFEDGSPTNSNYSNNSDCQWLIQPTDPNVIINLRFFRFSTEVNVDTLTVYDGSSTNDPILGTFSGNTLPNVTSSKGEMLVTFKTDSNNTSTGWRANYRTIAAPPCKALTTLTLATDTFTDGSKDGFDYAPNTTCTWLIQPTNALSIDLDFSRFETQSTTDFVTVYDGNSNAATSLGTFSGQPTISTISSTGGSLFLEFTTNGILEMNGWEARYTANLATIEANPDTIYLGDQINSTETFDIVANDAWAITDNAGWLSVSPTSGTGNQTATAEAIQANLFNQERIAEIYISSTVSNSKDTVIAIQQSNGNILSASTDTLFFDGNPITTQSLGINSNVNWNISTPANWISFSPTSGSNNGNTSVSATINNTNQPKISFLVLSGTGGVINDTVRVIQDTILPLSPFITVDPDTINLASPNGSNSSFTVNSNVVWQTTAGASWLTVTNPANTSDTNTVQITANSANNSTSNRASYVAVQDVNGTLFDTVYVNQFGTNIILSASPSSVSLNSPQGSNATVNLSSNINWTASSGANWLSANPQSGSGNASIIVTALSVNNTGTDRNSFIALEGGTGAIKDTIFVSQITAPKSLAVSPKSVALAQAINSNGSFTINSNIDWQTTAGATWITITNPSVTSDTGVVQLTANSMNNNPNSRTSFVVVNEINGSLFDTVEVIQLGTNPVLTTNPDTIYLAESANSSNSFSLVSNGKWILAAADTWISPSPTSGTGNGSITIQSNSANPNAIERTSYIAIEDTSNNLFDTVIVIQNAKTLQLTSSPDTIHLGPNVGNQATYNVDAPATTSWISNAKDNWINLGQTSGSGKSSILVTANSSNPSQNERTTFIVTQDNGFNPKSDTVYVIQDGQAAILDVTPSTLNLNSTSGSNDVISINSNLSWTVNNPVTWLSLNTSSGSNNGSVTATANSDNLTGSNRSTSLTFSAAGAADKIVTVTQIDGANSNFAVSRDTVYIDNPQGSTGTFAVLSNISSWTITENTSWLLVNPQSGSNTATITVLVATKNVNGNNRSAEVTVSTNGFNDQIVTIIQRGSTPLFQAAPSKLIIGPNPGDFADFNISSNLIAWKVSTSETWMDVSPSSGSFTDQVRVSATEKNTSGNVRNGVITIEAAPLVPQTIIVTQDTLRTTGIQEFEFYNNLQLYPNPTSGNVTLDFGISVNSNEVTYALFSMLGNRIELPQITFNGHKALIKLEGLSKGIYFLQMNYKGEIISRKISVIE